MIDLVIYLYFLIHLSSENPKFVEFYLFTSGFQIKVEIFYLEWYLRQSFKRFWMIIRKAGQIFDGS